MRTLLILMTIWCVNIHAFGQVKPVAQFYQKYKNFENAHDIKIQGWLLKIASKFADESETKKLLKKVTYLRALIVEESDLVSKTDLQSLLKSLQGNSFEPLIQIKDDGNHVDLFIREVGNIITDAVIVVHGSSSFVLLSIEGKLHFSDLNDLDFDIEGSEYFKQIPEKRSGLPKV